MLRVIRSLVLLAILVAMVVGATQWISRRPAAREQATPRQRPAPLVRTAVVDPTQLVEQSTFPGEVRASATADILSRTAGWARSSSKKAQ